MMYMPSTSSRILEKEHIRIAARDLLSTLNLNNCLGVSLTMKQSREGIILDEMRASQNLRHFLNKINNIVYAKRFKRFGKKLNVIPVLEKSLCGRYHYHLILLSPSHIFTKTFSSLLTGEWEKTYFGYRQSHIHNEIDVGWTYYITKFKSASDGIDWENYHWN